MNPLQHIQNTYRHGSTRTAKAKNKKIATLSRGRSVSMTRSFSKVNVNIKLDGEIPDFDENFPITCLNYKCPCLVIMWKERQRDDFLFKSSTKREGSVKPKKHIQIVTPSSTFVGRNDHIEASATVLAAPAQPKSDINTIVVKSVYDFLNRLAEIYLFKVPHIPRIFMQVLGIFTPHYKQLNKITLKRCAVTAYVIHELAKILKNSTISEVILDDSPFPRSNYAELLDVSGNLKELSLCRCNINDEVCKQLASKLDHFGSPGAQTLMLLNLTSNHITDEGVKYLGLALRTNRTLRYLNLSGNRITDDGATYILDTLVQFPLTVQEISAKRHRHMDYLKQKWSLLLKYTEEIENTYNTKTVNAYMKKKFKKSSPGKDKNIKVSITSENLKTRVAKMVDDMMGPYWDPFCSTNVRTRDGNLHCHGNMVLCYLNFAYNNLEYASLKKLLSVMIYQKSMISPYTGLMKVVLEGNNVPKNCVEMKLLERMFETYMVKNLSRSSRSCQSIKSVSKPTKH